MKTVEDLNCNVEDFIEKSIVGALNLHDYERWSSRFVLHKQDKEPFGRDFEPGEEDVIYKRLYG